MRCLAALALAACASGFLQPATVRVPHKAAATRRPAQAAPAWAPPIAVGAAGGAVVLVNRAVASFGPIPDSQGRADLIALLAVGALVLVGISNKELATREATPVALAGQRGRALSRTLAKAPAAAAAAEWAAASALKATPAVTALLWWEGAGAVLRLGVLAGAGAAPVDGDSPLLRKARAQPVNLPDLQALPARVELAALPRNTQAVLLQPVCGGRGVLVLGADRKRAFRPGDERWVGAVAGLLDEGELAGALNGAGE